MPTLPRARPAGCVSPTVAASGRRRPQRQCTSTRRSLRGVATCLPARASSCRLQLGWCSTRAPTLDSSASGSRAPRHRSRYLRASPRLLATIFCNATCRCALWASRSPLTDPAPTAALPTAAFPTAALPTAALPTAALLLGQDRSLEGRVAALRLALGASPSPSRRLTYYPNMPGNSTFHPHEKWEGRRAFRPERRAEMHVAEGYEAQVCTVSSLMRVRGHFGAAGAAGACAAVALLKVDVEGAEVEVLQGVEARDWPSILQVVVETHSSAKRRQVLGLLRERYHDVGEVADEGLAACGLERAVVWARSPLHRSPREAPPLSAASHASNAPSAVSSSAPAETCIFDTDGRVRTPFSLQLEHFYQDRHFLFSRYEEGVRLDAESWFSVTPECVARHISARLNPSAERGASAGTHMRDATQRLGEVGPTDGGRGLVRRPPLHRRLRRRGRQRHSAGAGRPSWARACHRRRPGQGGDRPAQRRALRRRAPDSGVHLPHISSCTSPAPPPHLLRISSCSSSSATSSHLPLVFAVTSASSRLRGEARWPRAVGAPWSSAI